MRDLWAHGDVGWHALYGANARLLGDDPGLGEADAFTLDGRRRCGICEAHKPEDGYGDARDRGICSACWADHNEMVEDAR